MLISRIQLERFLRLVFSSGKSQTQNNLALNRNMREAIATNDVTKPSTLVLALTNNVCATLMRYN